MVTNGLFIICFILVNLIIAHDAQSKPPPNIVFILFDDLGWNDVSYNNGQLPTPNIDDLFKTGISLNRHYIHLLCSISRSQFLTGRYSMYSGYGKMSPFGVGNIGGIPIGIPTIAQWLKSYSSYSSEYHYTTYAVGKWHIGYSIDEFLPTTKGFDHSFVFYNGAISYISAKIISNKCEGCNGDRYDLHDDDKDFNQWLTLTSDKKENHDDTSPIDTLSIQRDYALKYIQNEALSTTPFYMYLSLQSPHGPLDVLKHYHKKCAQLVGTDFIHRTKYCEVMLASDDIIGDIVDTLKSTNQWDDTLLILTTDNGGDIENTGCNYPFRGTKGTLFEGNQRVISIVSGGIIPEHQHETVRESLFSSLDWTPTLLQFAGIYDKIDEKDRTWDGINQYNLIMYGDEYKDRVDRDHIVFNIGLKNLQSATVVFKYPEGDNNKIYKYIAQDINVEKSQYNRLDGWCVPDDDTGNWNVVEIDIDDSDYIATQPLDNKFIFDLEHDIGEKNNILINNPNNNYDTDDIIDYVVSLFQPYLEHPLYSESIEGLWKYHKEEDRSSNGEFFVHSYLTMDEYIETINHYIETERKKHDNPISDELYALYTQKWISPFHQENNNEVMNVMNILNNTIDDTNNNMILIIMVLFISVLIAIALSIIKRCINDGEKGKVVNETIVDPSYGTF